MGSQRFGHYLATEKQQQQGKEFKQIKPSNDKKVVCIMNIARYGNINTTKKILLQFLMMSHKVSLKHKPQTEPTNENHADDI